LAATRASSKLFPGEQRDTPDRRIVVSIRRTDAVVASGGTKENAMTTVTLKHETTELREVSADELDQVTGAIEFSVPKLRADIYEGERFATGFVPPLWGAVC
jgi:hypothetical protein